MLKLKHLFHDRERALNILSRWEYDETQPMLMDNFRISANAVYPFAYLNERYYLRFAPEEEKELQHIRAELDFLYYLRKQGYPCLEPVLSKQGKDLEVVETPTGNYLAVVFRAVPGVSLASQELSKEKLCAWGKAMGRMHRLSKDYKPKEARRPSYQEQLAWMDEVLSGFPEEELARREARILSDWLTALPQSAETFGLIHYDFETDNVFYDEGTSAPYVIDFDDSVYHWFIMDVTSALASYEGDNPELAREMFIAGYQSEHQLEESMLALMPVFARYQSLYGYVRVIRSAREKLQDEPEWMVGLRQHFNQLCIERRALFGQEIN